MVYKSSSSSFKLSLGPAPQPLPGAFCQNSKKTANFKIGFKIQVLKNSTNLQNLQFQPNGTSLPELRIARNRTQVYGVTSNHLDQ